MQPYCLPKSCPLQVVDSRLGYCTLSCADPPIGPSSYRYSLETHRLLTHTFARCGSEFLERQSSRVGCLTVAFSRRSGREGDNGCKDSASFSRAQVTLCLCRSANSSFLVHCTPLGKWWGRKETVYAIRRLERPVKKKECTAPPNFSKASRVKMNFGQSQIGAGQPRLLPSFTTNIARPRPWGNFSCVSVYWLGGSNSGSRLLFLIAGSLAARIVTLRLRLKASWTLSWAADLR